MPRPTPAFCLGLRSLALCCALASAPLLHAGLSFRGTRVNAQATASMSWNSSANGQAGAEDYISAVDVLVEVRRRAGTLSLDLDAGMSFREFATFRAQNSTSPRFTLTIARDRGRLTGEFGLQAFQQATVDPVINTWTESWNLPVSLSLNYLVNSRYSVSSETGYASRIYADERGMVDYRDFSQSFALAYKIHQKLDLTSQYSGRWSRTSADTRASDHSFNVGLSGRLTGRMDGDLSVGYMTRRAHPGGQVYSGLRAGLDVNWRTVLRMDVTASLARDYSTSARGDDMDGTVGSLSADWALTRRWALSGSLSLRRARFLGGLAGEDGRCDTTFGQSLGVSYRPSSRLSLGLSGSKAQVRSTIGTYSRDDSSWTFSTTVRW